MNISTVSDNFNEDKAMTALEASKNTKPRFQPDLVWRYWTLTTVLIMGVLAGIEHSYQAVVILNVIQVVHFAMRERSVTAFPVQVRVAYLGLLFLSQAPYMIWILWWQLIGTTAMVTVKYCFLARLMSLIPWNKSEEYSVDLFKRTFFTPPIEGNVLQGLPEKTV
jgi:hypothetical protein